MSTIPEFDETMTQTMSQKLAQTMAQTMATVLAERAIRQVGLRYCRGIDRQDFDLVRSCYHADATDDHGDFSGGVEAFIAYCQRELVRFESTTHFMGNALVELTGTSSAVCETYVMAIHRVPASRTKPIRDFVVGLRYGDRFECRDGDWRIAQRVCLFDWTRTDPVVPGWQFPDSYRRGAMPDWRP